MDREKEAENVETLFVCVYADIHVDSHMCMVERENVKARERKRRRERD